MGLTITSAEDVVEAIWADVTDRTRVLFISHITSPTAVILSVAELIRRAREVGIITVVDGAHAPGQVSLDLEGQTLTPGNVTNRYEHNAQTPLISTTRLLLNSTSFTRPAMQSACCPTPT